MSISFVYGCIGGGEGSGKFKLIKFTNTENKYRTPLPSPPPFLMKKNHGFVPVVPSKRDLE